LVVIGVDAHKRIHVALALNDSGQEVGRWHGANHPAGWRDLAHWATGFEQPRQWGVEGAWGNGRGLAQYLVGAGETVYEINARWTAQGRRRARKPDKTDRQDARAIALVVRQEAPKLPVVFAEDETAVLDLLTTERESAVAESTRLQNQLHALLLQIDPEYESHLPGLTTRAGLAALETYVSPVGGRLQEARAASVRRLAKRLRLAVDQAREVKNQVEDLAQDGFAPLTKLCGVNFLTAATLAGILGPGLRFSTDAELAAYAGVCPLETSSAGTVRHRLNRGGNRRLNAVIYRIALTQAHHLAEARAYLDRRVSQGKSRREAHRCLRRFIVRALFRLWQECPSSAKESCSEAA
jgi:transposase